ncbi:hypothetical protein HanHA89_Chr03g0126081 [Helianthus annuus]|nr:hypothetical protein HanHA89_Chr03g0126081 [Helianthus annuus]
MNKPRNLLNMRSEIVPTASNELKNSACSLNRPLSNASNIVEISQTTNRRLNVCAIEDNLPDGGINRVIPDSKSFPLRVSTVSWLYLGSGFSLTQVVGNSSSTPLLRPYKIKVPTILQLFPTQSSKTSSLTDHPTSSTNRHTQSSSNTHSPPHPPPHKPTSPSTSPLSSSQHSPATKPASKPTPTDSPQTPPPNNTLSLSTNSTPPNPLTPSTPLLHPSKTPHLTPHP